MNDVTRQENRAAASREDGRQQQANAVRPPVDVIEDSGGITLTADLPGVSRDGLNIQVEGDTLTIEGQADITVPSELQSIYAEARASHFRRSFVLSDELDSEHIEASLEAGALTLRIPKQPTAQPRRIEIRA